MFNEKTPGKAGSTKKSSPIVFRVFRSFVVFLITSDLLTSPENELALFRQRVAADARTVETNSIVIFAENSNEDNMCQIIFRKLPEKPRRAQ